MRMLVFNLQKLAREGIAWTILYKSLIDLASGWESLGAIGAISNSGKHVSFILSEWDSRSEWHVDFQSPRFGKESGHSLRPSKLLSYFLQVDKLNKHVSWDIASSWTSVATIIRSSYVKQFHWACNGELFSLDYGVLGCQAFSRVLTCSHMFSHLFAPLLGHRNREREREQPEATKTYKDQDEHRWPNAEKADWAIHLISFFSDTFFC